MALVTIGDVRRAATRISEHVVRTPLIPCARLSDELGLRVLIKPENLQNTASFKVRGALNTMLTWQENGTLPEGVVGYSAGNHAAAVAYAGQRLGVKVIIAMPSNAVESKVINVRRYGGEIVFTDDLLGTCEELAARHGFPALLPFNLPEVIAGQGTVGLEIAQDLPGANAVLVPVGGGGLISGIGAAVTALSPATRVVGVEPEISNALALALRHGEVRNLNPVRPTLADGLAAPRAGEHTLENALRYVDEMAAVSEDAITAAWADMADATKLIVEPAAVVGLAALQTGAVTFPPGSTIVLVASGGNADLVKLAQVPRSTSG